MLVEIIRPGRFGKFEGNLVKSQHLDAGVQIEYPDRYARSLIASGWAVEVESQEPEPQSAELPPAVVSTAHSFFNVPFVKLRQVVALVAAGYTTFDELAAAPDDDLLAVDTIGPATLARIRRYLRIRQ
jgi:hypothetical protein